MIALTSTRIVVRQGILGRDTVQLRLQRITEVNISQTLIERVLGTGRVVIDVQGEDDSLTLEYVRKPAIVQRVINSQINEIVGGGSREPVPEEMLPASSEGRARHDASPSTGGARRDPTYEYDHEYDTPPFGVEVQAAPDSRPPEPAERAARFEIRDRLIELHDLRQRGILSEEEFAAKKSELLNRI